MNITLYMDVYPGMLEVNAMAIATPGKKYEGSKRYAIEVEIPDPNDPDFITPVQNPEEVDT